MGTLDNCEICRLPVLELSGQFAVLQPYYGESSDPAFTIAGTLHNTCLATSPLRTTWFDWQVQHYTGVRGYQLVNEADGWACLYNARQRSLLGFHTDGGSISLDSRDGAIVPVRGGGAVLTERDAHTSIPDREFVAFVHQELETKRRLPLDLVVDALGIRDKLSWPEVLETGQYVFHRPLRRDWGPTSFSARLQYRKLLPEPVIASWKSVRAAVD